MLLFHFVVFKYAEYLDLDFDLYNFSSSRNTLLFRKFCHMFHGTILDIVPLMGSEIKPHRTDNVQQPLEKSQGLSFLVCFSQECEEDKSALVDEYFQDHVDE